jgi:hypothetical protein
MFHVKQQTRQVHSAVDIALNRKFSGETAQFLDPGLGAERPYEVRIRNQWRLNV